MPLPLSDAHPHKGEIVEARTLRCHLLDLADAIEAARARVEALQARAHGTLSRGARDRLLRPAHELREAAGLLRACEDYLEGRAEAALMRRVAEIAQGAGG